MTSPTMERFALSGNGLVPSSARPDSREVDVIFLSGAALARWDAFSGGAFELVFDPAGADLTRLNSGAAPVLDSHRDAPLSNQLGVVVKAWRAGKQFLATLRFSDREPVETIWRDVLAGVLKGISVGAELLESRDERDSTGKLVRRVATKWRPLEISLVAIPADAGAVTLKHETNGVSMETQNSQNLDSVATERARVSLINQIGTRAGMTAEAVQNAISGGSTVETFKGIVADHLMAESLKQPDTRIGAACTSQVIRDYGEKAQDSMVEALYSRSAGRAPAEVGRQWHGRRLADMARELLSIRGVRVTGGDSNVIREALMHSTGDFPNLLSGLAGKMLLEAYTAAESGLKLVARRSTANDFKEKYVLRRGEFPALELVPEGGEYKSGTIGEAKESYSLGTYGKIFSITRQALVNDDLGAFSSMAFAVGQAAASYEAKHLANLLLANSQAGPVMSDGENLFSVAHKNTGTGTIGSTGLDTARAAMRTQVGLDGTTIIDARPKFLLTSAAKQGVAEQYCASITAVTAATVNPFGGLLTPVSDPRLDAGTAAKWYLFADPAICPVIEYAYLAGAEGVQIEQKVGFEIDGLQIKARLDFGAGAVDWRGAYISSGS